MKNIKYSQPSSSLQQPSLGQLVVIREITFSKGASLYAVVALYNSKHIVTGP